LSILNKCFFRFSPRPILAQLLNSVHHSKDRCRSLLVHLSFVHHSNRCRKEFQCTGFHCFQLSLFGFLEGIVFLALESYSIVSACQEKKTSFFRFCFFLSALHHDHTIRNLIVKKKKKKKSVTPRKGGFFVSPPIGGLTPHSRGAYKHSQQPHHKK
jgi:hypothetical protein